jgi:hypothetical protein
MEGLEMNIRLLFTCVEVVEFSVFLINVNPPTKSSNHFDWQFFSLILILILI